MEEAALPGWLGKRSMLGSATSAWVVAPLSAGVSWVPSQQWGQQQQHGTRNSTGCFVTEHKHSGSTPGISGPNQMLKTEHDVSKT